MLFRIEKASFRKVVNFRKLAEKQCCKDSSPDSDSYSDSCIKNSDSLIFLLELGLGLGLGLVAKNSHSDSDLLKKQRLPSRKNNSNKRSSMILLRNYEKKSSQPLAARHLIVSCRIVKLLDKHKADGLPLQQPDLSMKNSCLQNFVAIIKRNLS